MPKTPPGWILAAYYWSPYLAFAVLTGERIVELTCHRLTGGQQATDLLNEHFQALAQDYHPDCIAVPPVAALYEAAKLTGYPVKTITMTTAKETLLGTEYRGTHRDLLMVLGKRCPELNGHIPKFTGGRSDTAAVRSRRAVQLFPVALGLAATTTLPKGNHVSPT